MAFDILDIFAVAPPFSFAGGITPTVPGGFVNMVTGLRDGAGNPVIALYVGNDATVYVAGAQVNGAYLNAASVAFTIYGDDGVTPIFGPEDMPSDGLGTGGYTAAFESSDLKRVMTSGQMVVDKYYRISISFSSSPYDAETDVWYPLLYRRGAI